MNDSSRPSRVLGSILFAFGLVNGICYLNMLRPDVFVDGKNGQTMATIIAVTPSHDFLRRGNIHRYRFLANNDPYQGTFHRRNDWMGHYAIGKSVAVEYRLDDPGVNRLKGHIPPYRPLVLAWILFMVAMTVYGGVLFYTGRDPIREWRDEWKSRSVA